MDVLKQLLLRFLQVPPEPHPPVGERLRVFRASRSYLHYKLVLWGLRQLGVIAGILFVVVIAQGVLAPKFAESSNDFLQMLSSYFQYDLGVFGFFELMTLGFYLVQAPFSYVAAFLDYEYRWYMVTDRSLRIREGIVRVVEQTMTFSNIQNVSVRQGPVQRMFGIAEVEVRTAGGGEHKPEDGKPESANLHVAHFRGVDNAAEIRDMILDRLRLAKTSGLGDPEEVEAHTTPDSPHDTPVEAARLLLAEARALGRVIS